MLHRLETPYDQPVIFHGLSLKLERNTRVWMSVSKMKLTHHKKSPVAATEPMPKQEEHTDIPACLNNYLFW